MPPRRSGGEAFLFSESFHSMSAEKKTGPARWEKLGEHSVAQTRVLELMSVRYRHPHRTTERDFVVVRPSDWVNVVALTRDGHIVLVRQFRFGIDTFSLEIPGGIIETGE